jgi:hypothetical protein
MFGVLTVFGILMCFGVLTLFGILMFFAILMLDERIQRRFIWRWEVVRRIKNFKLETGLLLALAGFSLVGCAQTAAPAPDIIQRAQGETPAPPPPSGFLGSDYSLLQPGPAGSGQQAMLAYTNMTANFTSYNAITIAPVTFWADENSQISAADQQSLCNYFQTVLVKDFSKNFTVVDDPGPGVAKLTVALTDASAAIPVLRTIAILVP